MNSDGAFVVCCNLSSFLLYLFKINMTKGYRRQTDDRRTGESTERSLIKCDDVENCKRKTPTFIDVKTSTSIQYHKLLYQYHTQVIYKFLIL